MKKQYDRKTYTAEGKKRIDVIKREWEEYLKTFSPKIINTYEENGKVIKVYEAR